MRVDGFASERHYVDHLAPIWQALDESERGRFIVANATLATWAARRGVTAEVATLNATDPRPVLTASFIDHAEAARRRQRPWIILVEHGAGQHYGGDDSPSRSRHGSYSGGHGREAVRLFLCPNETVAQRNREVYPDAAIEVVGCPKLDAWHTDPPPRPSPGPPIVALSFHWDTVTIPEARTALPHYVESLVDLGDSFRLVGHGHPRIAERLEATFAKIGVPFVVDFEQILDAAALYVCDNSSTLYEFASLDRPVVALNAPWYRRDVDHGLRFWNLIPGLTCDDPGDLPWTIRRALEDPPAARTLRTRAVETVYAMRDGNASERAVEAIRRHYREETP